jgi:RimJ/RimL family protein N-acetyltransferase
MLELQTERLVLIALAREHLELALNDIDQLAAALQIQVSEEVFSDESRQAMLIKMTRMDHVEHWLHPWYTYFLLVQRSDRQAVGVCGFKGQPTLYGSVELGYAMHEGFRKRGYMTEAVGRLVQWAFTHDNCTCVTAETLRDNFASQKVLLKAGLVLYRSSDTMLYWKIDKKDYAAGTGP